MAHDLEDKPAFLQLDRATAADILSPDVVGVGEQESIVMAGYLMRESRIHHLPVLRGDTVVGMLDEAVLSEALSRLSWSELQRPVSSVMHRDVVRVHPWTSLRDVAVHLGYSRSGAVVVTAHARLVGIVTSSDVIAAVARTAPTVTVPDARDAALS